jgi:hypothetical protein
LTLEKCGGMVSLHILMYLRPVTCISLCPTLFPRFAISLCRCFSITVPACMNIYKTSRKITLYNMDCYIIYYSMLLLLNSGDAIGKSARTSSIY